MLRRSTTLPRRYCGLGCQWAGLGAWDVTVTAGQTVTDRMGRHGDIGIGSHSHRRPAASEAGSQTECRPALAMRSAVWSPSNAVRGQKKNRTANTWSISKVAEYKSIKSSNLTCSSCPGRQCSDILPFDVGPAWAGLVFIGLCYGQPSLSFQFLGHPSDHETPSRWDWLQLIL